MGVDREALGDPILASENSPPESLSIYSPFPHCFTFAIVNIFLFYARIAAISQASVLL
jgi:hypothetical protein